MLTRRLTALVLMLILLLAALSPAAVSETMPYRITVDVSNNIVTVYSTANGSIVRQMICSAGAPITPTITGTYTMPTKKRDGEREEWYTFVDGYGKWGSRIEGNYLFHSYLFYRKDDNTVFWESYAAMGTNASHGCIRLYIEDAKWIAENCLAGTKVKLYKTDERYDYIKELLYERSYTIDSGITYQEFASMASDDTELGYTSEGDDVALLQARLVALGLYAGDVDGYYGQDMVRTVKIIQSALGLEETGVADENFLSLIRGEDVPTSTLANLRQGMSGPSVRAAQTLLANLGLYEGELDGVFDAEMHEAVVLCQRLLGYEETGRVTTALMEEAKEMIAGLNATHGIGNFAMVLEEKTVIDAVVHTNDELNMREDMSTDSNVIAKLEPGTRVSVLDGNKKWARVSFDGTEGYVKTEYLNISEKTVLMPTYIKADATHKAVGVAPTGQMIPTQRGMYGIANKSARLSIWESSVKGARLSFLVPPSTVVRIISANDTWAFVSYGGKKGFAKLSSMKVVSVIELAQTAPTANVDEKTTENDAVYAHVTNDKGAQLFSSASKTSDVLATLPTAKRAEVIFKSTSWTQVRAGDQTGYVSNDDVFAGTEAEIDEYLAELEAAKKAFAVVSTGSEAHLNMRTAASSDAEIARTLENGTIVEVKSDDGIWCEIEYDRKTGYVMSQYVLAIDDSGAGTEFDAKAAGYDDYLLDEVTDEEIEAGGN